MRGALAAGLAAAVSLAPKGLAACACGLVVGPTAPLTGAADRAALSAGLSVMQERYNFDEFGRLSRTPSDVRVHRGWLDLAAAWRPDDRWELSASASYALSRVSLFGVEGNAHGVGDTVLRARRVMVDAGAGWRPTVDLWAGLRLPTATHDDRALASVGGPGLGAFELSLGAELRWRVGVRWQLALSAELGARSPSLEGASMPGPRALVAGLGVWQPHPRVALSVAPSVWVEAAPWQGGTALANGALRRSSVAMGVTVQADPWWRVGASAAGELPVEGFGQNVAAYLRAGLNVTRVW
ncbi:MAG: hypothetical protein JNK72_19065 [Myxococcales bacterium]|nr:hypothetical protein [Myxococcales bacterium]